MSELGIRVQIDGYVPTVNDTIHSRQARHMIYGIHLMSLLSTWHWKCNEFWTESLCARFDKLLICES